MRITILLCHIVARATSLVSARKKIAQRAREAGLMQIPGSIGCVAGPTSKAGRNSPSLSRTAQMSKCVVERWSAHSFQPAMKNFWQPSAKFPSGATLTKYWSARGLVVLVVPAGVAACRRFLL